MVTFKISGNPLKQGSRTYSVPWASAEIYPVGGNVNILFILFMLLTMQCNCTCTKRFTLSTP